MSQNNFIKTGQESWRVLNKKVRVTDKYAGTLTIKVKCKLLNNVKEHF